MTTELLRRWKVILAIVFFVLCVGVIAAKGVKYGIDFEGGTLFQIQLEAPVNDPEAMQQIVGTIQQRLDWTGLRDTKVNAWGNQFIVAQIAETDPATVERLESLIKRQGRFEVVFDANTVFTGDDIIRVIKDPARGYAVTPVPSGYQWILPFSLKESAAVRFRDATWHQCKLSTFDPTQGRTYECKKTYFYIDRPQNAVLLLPDRVARADRDKLLAGNHSENIPSDTTLEEVLQNSSLLTIRFSDANQSRFSSDDWQKISDANQNANLFLVPASLSQGHRDQLAQAGIEVRVFSDAEDAPPFSWTATGLRQIISLTENVVFLNVPDSQRQSTSPLLDLQIQGFDSSKDDASASLKDLEVLLESGSLPVSVQSVSKETISPLLGTRFLHNALFIYFVALLGVVALLWLRYRKLKIVLPILLTDLVEATGVVGLAAFFGWSLDLAGVAGILAAVGTGVNDQIVMVDELLKNRDSETAVGSLVERLRRALFIVFAAAATLLVTMLPLIVFGFGLGKLVGFAITTIAGVLVGVFITRPAFGEVAEWILSNEKK